MIPRGKRGESECLDWKKKKKTNFLLVSLVMNSTMSCPALFYTCYIPHNIFFFGAKFKHKAAEKTNICACFWRSAGLAEELHATLCLIFLTIISPPRSEADIFVTSMKWFISRVRAESPCDEEGKSLMLSWSHIHLSAPATQGSSHTKAPIDSEPRE